MGASLDLRTKRCLMAKQIKDLVRQLKLKEKITLQSGHGFWHLSNSPSLDLPKMMVTDGPHGLRKQLPGQGHFGYAKSIPSTCFPTASALAASWDRQLLYDLGQALGEACLQEEVSVILGPGMNIKRSPLCGRNFEYYSEDPFLTAEMAIAQVKGIQSQGVGATIKHFVANHQEKYRMVMNAVVDDIALSELYLYAFKKTILEAKPWMVMTAYNRINGYYASEHPILLKALLRDQWQYDGVVISDWGAVHDRVASANMGLDIEMPGNEGISDQTLKKAIAKQALKESVLDDSTGRIVKMMLRAEQLKKEKFTYDQDKQHALAKRIALESAVLLKNDDGLLPLKRTDKIAVVGQFAKSPRYQGTGSSRLEPTRLQTFWDELAKEVSSLTYAPGYHLNDVFEEALIDEAMRHAEEADVTIAVIGLTDAFETEGVDRDHMGLPTSQNALISGLAQVTSRLLVVLYNGSPVEMPWVSSVPAILECYLSGQAGAEALVDLILGEANPCGKLAETFAKRLEDYPKSITQPTDDRLVYYKESVYVGYRYFNTANVPVLFPFGHGLSYTQFEYKDIKVSRSAWTSENTLWLSCQITNTGQQFGQEIVQLYLSRPPGHGPAMAPQLKGFEKIGLEPGQTKEVKFILEKKDLAQAISLDTFKTLSGPYGFEIGASSKDLRLKTRVFVHGDGDVVKSWPRSYHAVRSPWYVPLKDFEALMARPLEGVFKREGPLTMQDMVLDMRSRRMGRWLLDFVNNNIKTHTDHETTAKMLTTFIEEMPISHLYMMSNGVLNEPLVKGWVHLLNHHWLRGIGQLFVGTCLWLFRKRDKSNP